MEQSRYLIVLPTYDERENLPRMIDALAAIRDQIPMPGEVLVVDDGSPDGTGQLADQLAARHDWLHVLHRPAKQGLGRAYLAGFQWALQRPFSHVIEMDCDLSHPVSALPAMLEASRHADLVLGSRYTPGGVRSTSRWRAAIWPLPISSATLSEIVSPTPDSSVRRPCCDSRTTDSGVSRSVFAARR